MPKAKSPPRGADQKPSEGGSADTAGPSIRKDPADTERRSKVGKGLKSVAGKRDKDEV